ncbi:hypothetical protein [Streptomyces sp. NPDC056982]|uniref:hypothetical protein n=1 Tax=Streptomyces sp. NPDC056982 TaxID=3345986 RepID=UPI00362C4382
MNRPDILGSSRAAVAFLDVSIRVSCSAQPWRFIQRTGSRSVARYGDPDHTLPYGDVEHRALRAGVAVNDVAPSRAAPLSALRVVRRARCIP